MSIVQERTWGGRLFQTVGAAVRKAPEPNDKLDRAMDNTLAEADRKALHVFQEMNFPRWRPRAAILDLAKPEIAPFDPPTSKTPK